MNIAVDFDGVIAAPAWPGVGEPNEALIQWLIDFREAGNKIILWTCRVDEALENAVAFCKNYGLEFDAVNDNLPEIVEFFGDNSRKITADYYIDDKAVLIEFGKEIRK